MNLRAEVVTDAARFAELRQPWRQLWERSAGFIFQDHDWITGWLSAAGTRPGITLEVALVWDGDRLCGAMPCAVHRRMGLRVLIWAAQLFSDYCDSLVDPDYEHAGILPMLWESLHRSGGFDLINLQQVRPDAKCRPFLDHLAGGQSGLHYGNRSERCMRIENRWPNGEAFFRSLNKKARNNHTRGKRILTELGGEVTFRCADAAEDIPLLLEQVLQFKQAWLRTHDPRSSLLGPDGVIQRSILDNVLRLDLAKIFVLECAGRLAAASINFVYAGRMEAYFTAYDAAFDRASPGTILIVEYARWSFDRGLAHVDFLRGEEPFKFRMANACTLLSSFAGARTPIGQIALTGHRWVSKHRHRKQTSDAVATGELEAVG